MVGSRSGGLPVGDPERNRRAAAGRRGQRLHRRLRRCKHADDPEGQAVFIDGGVLYGPGKAANAGGVAVSALEMPQSSQRLYSTREEVDQRLHGIMKRIHQVSLDAATEYGTGNYLNGANIAGFTKVADAMIDQGSSEPTNALDSVSSRIELRICYHESRRRDG